MMGSKSAGTHTPAADPVDEDEIAGWPRRHETRRQVVEEALRPFVARYGLLPEAITRLSDEIYQLWRHHERDKSLQARGRRFEVQFRRDARALAQRAARLPDRDEREHATRMVRLATLERRKVGSSKAIEGAIDTTFADLSTREKREVRWFLGRNWLPGSKVRIAALEVSYLKKVVAVLERETGERLKFSSRPPGARLPKHGDDVGPDTAEELAGRHYGPAFAVVRAAAQMANYKLTNEALATLIRRIRGSKPDPQEGG